MSRFRVDEDRARRLAQILVSMEYKPDDLAHISPFRDDPFRDTHFIFFMTAIDHNTHAGCSRYETTVGSAFTHGSDLLYALAIATARSDRDLFTPPRMRQVTEKQLAGVFATPEGRLPAGLGERAMLLSDAAARLITEYGGDVRELFRQAEGYVRGLCGRGIVERLSPFRAYEDPIGKKTFLLIKLLRRRGLLTVKDPEKIDIPVDHVVFTLALRSGLVVAEPSVTQAILVGTCLADGVVRDLREETLRAYRMVARYARLTADEFDDLLWAYGRECLRDETPFPETRIGSIRLPLEARIANAEALDEFIRFITGIDGHAPRGASRLPVPVIPPTWYI